MMTYQPEEKTRLKRQREEQAINLAMHSKWDEAVAVNQSIVELFPKDVDSHNRLGKALTELGRYGAARAAYSKAVELDPANTIARKNLSRLAGLKETPRASTASVPTAKVDPRLFIAERGKTAVVALQQPAARETIARVNAGDQVSLRVRGRTLVVENTRGEYLGLVEPKLALRIIKLMDGGNRYAAAVTSVGDSSAKVIIKEVFQAPAMAGTLSFPATADTGFRSYTRDTLLRYGYEDEDEGEEGRYPDETSESWGENRGRSWRGEVEEPENDQVQPLPEEDDEEEEVGE